MKITTNGTITDEVLLVLLWEIKQTKWNNKWYMFCWSSYEK